MWLFCHQERTCESLVPLSQAERGFDFAHWLAAFSLSAREFCATNRCCCGFDCWDCFDDNRRYDHSGSNPHCCNRSQSRRRQKLFATPAESATNRTPPDCRFPAHVPCDQTAGLPASPVRLRLCCG